MRQELTERKTCSFQTLAWSQWVPWVMALGLCRFRYKRNTQSLAEPGEEKVPKGSLISRFKWVKTGIRWSTLREVPKTSIRVSCMMKISRKTYIWVSWVEEQVKMLSIVWISRNHMIASCQQEGLINTGPKERGTHKAITQLWEAYLEEQICVWH